MVIDAKYLQRQKDWSSKTFGPMLEWDFDPSGTIDHIKKELKEIKKDPYDLFEWVDVIILAFDGALRAGCDPQDIINGIIRKQTINEGRTWPDWKQLDDGKAIEHIR